MSTATTSGLKTRQGELGQFLTPSPVAEFMASLFTELPKHVRLLDAGAGAGELTRAFVSRVCAERSAESIHVTLYEIDPVILSSLSQAMGECRHRCDDAGIRFGFTIRPENFITEVAGTLASGLFVALPATFDAAIVNPPYRKISSDSPERRALQTLGIETSNLYTGFVALIQRLLAPKGQLVGITPRSFCNGPYFRPFREDFLNSMALHQIHVFDSRQAAFRDDKVLQENIIFHAVKGAKQPRTVLISSSSGEPGAPIHESAFALEEVVHPGDQEKFIHIPSSPSHSTAKAAMSGLTTSLADLGLTVSTGRVVDFRLKSALRAVPEVNSVPLIYPCHFNGGVVHWPKAESKKPNAILDTEETRPWLVPSGAYLLTKRFTSKEERRRLVACLYDPAVVLSEWVGIENHLNYIHADGHGLDRDLAKGLFAYLNSTVVDQYFRRFSGHTQVNATDLRVLTYPTRETLVKMGRAISRLDLPQAELDLFVAQHLHGSR
jgi:adenine-specific DNA-methyltransferase